jgi:hypothetical protein
MSKTVLVRGGTCQGISTVGGTSTFISSVLVASCDQLDGIWEVVDWGVNITQVQTAGVPPVVNLIGKPVLQLPTDQIVKNSQMKSSLYTVARGMQIKFNQLQSPFAYGFGLGCIVYHSVVANASSIQFDGEYWVMLQKVSAF